VKTLRIRIFPDSEQRDWIEQIHDQYRWFYNAALNIAHGDCGNFLREGKCSEISFRNLFKTYRYEELREELPDGRYFLVKQLVQDPNWSGWPIPTGQQLLHNRVARGAAVSLARALNSGLANMKAGNIRRFQLSYKSKKRDSSYSSLFEDASFPKEFLCIPGKWCYRNQSKQRTYMDWKNIFKDKRIVKSGFVLEYDCLKRKHYILYTVPVDWEPEDRLESENQAFERSSKEPRTISLDPGVRTFLTGYDPDGQVIVFGDGSADRLWKMLLQYDRLISRLKESPHEPGFRRKLWRNVRKRQDLCRELHWKCASFLVSNYDLIFLPHFRTGQMLQGKTISKRTKRLLQAFQFYQFKERLAFQCRKHGKCLIFVEEHYTSKTCGRCGKINWELGGNKTFNCSDCGLCSDRDENAARNILLKQLPLLVAEGTLLPNSISSDS
jgi:IS605 OrfB family transposase